MKHANWKDIIVGLSVLWIILTVDIEEYFLYNFSKVTLLIN